MKKIDVIDFYRKTTELESTINQCELKMKRERTIYSISSFMISIIGAVINGTVSNFSGKENLSFFLLINYFLSIIYFGLCLYIAIFILMFFFKRIIPTFFEIVFSDRYSTKIQMRYKDYFYQCMVPRLSLLNEYDFLIDLIENDKDFENYFSSIKFEIMMKYSKYIHEMCNDMDLVVPLVSKYKLRNSIYKNYLIYIDYPSIKKCFMQFQKVFDNYKCNQNMWEGYFCENEIKSFNLMLLEVKKRLEYFEEVNGTN